MKKCFITFLVVVVFLANPSSFKAEVKWDGAQIVKGQTGKMTFTKDVKVYKKNTDGSYSSMTVKRNNYFRVYDIEKYDNKIFYWMSSGYRVQATDLVVFKKIPLNIRASLYDNPGYININNNQGIGNSYGKHYLNKHWDGGGAGDASFSFEISIGENLHYTYHSGGGADPSEQLIDGADIRIAETTKRDEGFYTLTANAPRLSGPINGASLMGNYSKGTVFLSLGTEINGYLMVSELDKFSAYYEPIYIPVSLLQPTQNQGKRYMRYGVEAWKDGKGLELKRFDEVTLLAEKGTTAWVEIDGETYAVPKKALATIKPNESPIITTSFLPNDTLQQLVYGYEVYKRTANNRFEAERDDRFIDYYETEKNFNYVKDGREFIFEKPITEGSRVTRGWSEMEGQVGFVRAIHYTFTTEAGTFNNVVETSHGDLFAPGFGVIQGDSGYLSSYE